MPSKVEFSSIPRSCYSNDGSVVAYNGSSFLGGLVLLNLEMPAAANNPGALTHGSGLPRPHGRRVGPAAPGHPVPNEGQPLKGELNDA
ncbi:unnamed protein product [Hydatigera taeniaeformis]|uniref:Uncharacterized protein n=1 Tax=Hydatigena taeniaeformis TaxID=6205 RepID=A0A0R3X1S1_HYDTA|nr:unnamed protein product [Hydatigera taeniaeformis]